MLGVGLTLARSLTMSQSLVLAEAIRPSMLLDTSRQMATSMVFLFAGLPESAAPAGSVSRPQPNTARAAPQARGWERDRFIVCPPRGNGLANRPRARVVVGRISNPSRQVGRISNPSHICLQVVLGGCR